MSTYDILLRPAWAGLSSEDSGAYFSWQPFEAICRRIHERATRSGHARLAQASLLHPETEEMYLFRLDAAGWNLVIEEVDAILADPDFFAYEKDLREQDHYIQHCQRLGLDPDEVLRMDRKAAEGGLRHLRDKLTEMVEQGEGPSPRDKHCERVMHSDIIFRPYSPYSPEKCCASFYGRPFEEICRRIQERACRLKNVRLAEAAQDARLDGYLALDLLRAADWRLVIEELDAIFAAADFYMYEKEQNAQPWFVESCRREGQTANEFQHQVREATAWQLRHLRENLTELMREAKGDWRDVPCTAG